MASLPNGSPGAGPGGQGGQMTSHNSCRCMGDLPLVPAAQGVSHLRGAAAQSGWRGAASGASCAGSLSRSMGKCGTSPPWLPFLGVLFQRKGSSHFDVSLLGLVHSKRSAGPRDFLSAPSERRTSNASPAGQSCSPSSGV